LATWKWTEGTHDRIGTALTKPDHSPVFVG
jgi:hypothetical protein